MSTTYVYTGPWIDWSHGQFFGATITLPTQNGGFLLSFLTLYVTFAGSGFWSICAFLLHQAGAGQKLRNALHHQIQAILRNGGDELGVVWALSRVSFAWRRHRKHLHIRSLLLILFALAAKASWAFAGLFSSQVIKTSGSYLLLRGNSEQCGSWDFPSDQLGAFASELKVANDTLTAASYARQCYGSNDRNPLQCSAYIHPQLHWTTDLNASCPFESGTCAFSDTAAYQMDTGLLNSHDDLGINAPKSERVAFRKVSTCAPLLMRPYARLENETVNGATFEFLRLYLGTQDPPYNWTYEYNMKETSINIGYDVRTIFSQTGIYGGWEPLPEFNRTDADVSMFFISANAITYDAPVEDPVFSANIELHSTVVNVNYTSWVADEYIGVLGCADQFQFCNPTNTGIDSEATCTPLTGSYDLIRYMNGIGLNPSQFATEVMMYSNSLLANTYYSVGGRGSSALRAQESVFDQSSGPLPNNQWQIELDSWFSISLARLQQSMIEYVSGNPNNKGATREPLATKDSQALCNKQMIHNTGGYENFSILGISIILVGGTILIILGLTIDTIVDTVQAKLKRPYRRLVYVTDGYLQTQRMAFEGAGYEGWHECDSAYPVYGTPEGASQQMGGLDMNAPDFAKHPRLERFKGATVEPKPLETTSLNHTSRNRSNENSLEDLAGDIPLSNMPRNRSSNDSFRNSIENFPLNNLSGNGSNDDPLVDLAERTPLNPLSGNNDSLVDPANIPRNRSNDSLVNSVENTPLTNLLNESNNESLLQSVERQENRRLIENSGTGL